MKKKDLLKMISACLVFVIFFEILTAVLMPKWNSYHSDQMQTRIQAFYHQEKNSQDVIYLGSSYAYCGISPLRIWEEQGITGYVFAGTGQKTWISTYYLKEALKYQTPKVVVFEVGAIFDEKDASEENNRKNIDYMRWSPVKISAIKDICENTGESKKEYLFPFLRYHSRWRDLEQKDFHLKWDSSYYLMGTLSWCATRPASEKKIEKYQSWEADGQKAGTLKVGNRCRKAVLEMKEICEENGIEFQLVRIPSLEWSLEKAQAVQNFADENGIPYLDMNLYRKQTGIDWTEDTPDKGEHLNILGCRKASSYLGEYLASHYEFNEELSEKNKKFWRESVEKFDEVTEKYENEKKVEQE